MTVPTLDNPITQLVSQSQCEELLFYTLMREIGHESIVNRKHWEFAYIMSSIWKSGYRNPFYTGLGFGIGKEPIPAWLARKGISVDATDLPGDGGVWSQTNQHVRSSAQIPWEGICSSREFNTFVKFYPLDMNNIPYNFRQGGYDFVWSCSALDHLGSLKNAKDFIFNSLECVKPGGIAVHTTEFNLSPEPLDRGAVVAFRDVDIYGLQAALEQEGHRININLERGTKEMDIKVVGPPYNGPHLNIMLGQYRLTSIGITILKGREDNL